MDEGREELVVVGTPPLAATTTGELPLLPGGISNVPSGSFVQGPQISASTVPVDSAWSASAVGDQFSTPSATAGVLANAAYLTGSGLNVYWSDNLFLDAIKDWIDPTSPALGGPPTPTSFGYAPARARWLRAQSTGSGTPKVVATPKIFTELEQRGERLYCAAQAAFAKAGKTPVLMGKRALASIKILGKRIDLMALEPTVTMASPQKVAATTNDGAQGFVIPLAAGVRVTPLSLFRSLPELRAPVILMTADMEAAARANVKAAANTFKEWQTLTHVDAFASGNQVIAKKETPKILIASIGPVPIYGKFGVQLEIASCAQASSMSACKSSPNGPVKRLLGGMYANGAVTALPSSYPRPRTGNWTTPLSDAAGTYNDDAWIINFAGNSLFDATGATPNFSLPNTGSPLMTRMAQDDDKSMDLRTGMTLSSELSSGGEITLTPLTLSVSIAGTMNVNGSVVHSFREQEEVRMRQVTDSDGEFTWTDPDPVTALTVTPSMEGSLTFGTSASMTIKLLSVPFIGTLSKTFSLWKASTAAITTSTGRWPEKSRLRIGTAHEVNGTLVSDAESHWPRSATFPSFPQSLSACLAPTPPVTVMPAPCASFVPPAPPGGTTTAPVANLCFYYPTFWDTDPDLDDDVRTCKTALAAYASSATTLQQVASTGAELAGQTVNAHIVSDNPNSSADRNRFKAAVDKCANAYKSAAPVQNELHFAPCDGTGKLFGNFIEPIATPAEPVPTDASIGAPSACN